MAEITKIYVSVRNTCSTSRDSKDGEYGQWELWRCKIKTVQKIINKKIVHHVVSERYPSTTDK